MRFAQRMLHINIIVVKPKLRIQMSHHNWEESRVTAIKWLKPEPQIIHSMVQIQ